jgi:hypothetical protein
MLSSASLFFWGKDLKFIKIPEVRRLHGEEAVEVLKDYIDGLKHDKEKKLTKKQKRALIKISGSLITSIEAEMRSKKAKKMAQAPSEQDPFTLFKRIFPWIPR